MPNREKEKMFVVKLLVFMHHLNMYVQSGWELCKEWLRVWLGPSTKETYAILADDTVVPDIMTHAKYPPVCQYFQQDRRIVATVSTEPFKRVPWISIEYKLDDYYVDLSDWLGELRTNTTISLLATLRLASATLRIPLPETDAARVSVIRRTGEEKEYVFRGKRDLVVPTRHRPTCLEDMETHAGLPLF